MYVCMCMLCMYVRFVTIITNLGMYQVLHSYSSLDQYLVYVCMYVCIILEPAVGAEERNRVEGSGCPGQVVVGRLLRDDSLPLCVLSGAIEIEISIVRIM